MTFFPIPFFYIAPSHFPFLPNLSLGCQQDSKVRDNQRIRRVLTPSSLYALWEWVSSWDFWGAHSKPWDSKSGGRSLVNSLGWHWLAVWLIYGLPWPLSWDKSELGRKNLIGLVVRVAQGGGYGCQILFFHRGQFNILYPANFHVTGFQAFWPWGRSVAWTKICI